MAKYGPSSAFLLVGGKNISSDTFTLKESVRHMLNQTNGLSKTWEEHLPIGVASVGLEAGGGFYDDAVAGIVEALQGQGATRQLVSFGLSSSITGAEAMLLDGAFAAVWDRIAQKEGLTKADAKYTVTGDYKRGKIIHGLNAETATSGNTEGPSVDNGASSANGATADLHVPALTLGGFTSVTVKVRHSTDDITYADLITFSAVTAIGAQRATVSGTVNRHLAMSWLFNGAGSGQSIVPYVVVNRG